MITLFIYDSRRLVNLREENMRVFIGLKVGEALTKTLHEWQNAHQDIPVRWVHPEDFHLTLITPWEADSLDDAKRLLFGMEDRTAFPLLFKQISSSGELPHPNVLWAEAFWSKDFAELQSELKRFFPFKSDSRNPRPHITLGRFPQKIEITPGHSLSAISEEVSWKDTPLSLALFETKRIPLLKDEPNYRVLALKKLV